MIKVIDGIRYNTKSAELVFEWSNGYHSGDFSHRGKALYRTKSKSWFFHHYGGPFSDMGTISGRNRVGSESIEPVEPKDAMRFLEKHSGDSEALEALEKYFGDSIKDA